MQKKEGKFQIVVIPLLVGILLIFISFMLIRPNTTGNVISLTGKAVSIPNDCSESSIKTTWGSIFKESSTDINISSATFSGGKCTSFTAFKIKNNQELYLLIGLDITILNTNMTSYNAQYMNFTPNYLNSSNFILNQINVTNVTKRNFNSIDLATSEFSNYFKITPTLWQINLTDKGSRFIFNDSSKINETTIEQIGGVEQNYTSNFFGFVKQVSQTPSSSNCTPNWTQTSTNCTADDLNITYYTDKNNCPNQTNRPANITSICDYDHNGLIGSFTTSQAHNMEVSLLVDGLSLNSSAIYNSTKVVEFKEGNITRINFNYNFSVDPLILKNITIRKQPSSFNYGYLIVEGLEVPKTITIDKLLNSSTQICAVDREIENIDEISPNCDGEEEHLLECPANNGTITCNISEGKFIVSGLSKSAVKELTENITTKSQIICTSNWTCQNWSNCANGNEIRTCTDSNNCSIPTSQPILSQVCACMPKWSCSPWDPAECPNNRTQIRTCTDSNNCNTQEGKEKYPEKQTCVYTAKVNFKIILLTIAIILGLLATVVIVYLIIKNINKSKSQNENIIISKPQIPPQQMPINNPYSQNQFLPPSLPLPQIPQQPIIPTENKDSSNPAI